MAARLFRRSVSAMQSGKAWAGIWVLQFESRQKMRPDPLTGWTGGSDTKSQVTLTFPTKDAALAYAKREAIDVHVVETGERVLKLQSYADNFR